MGLSSALRFSSPLFSNTLYQNKKSHNTHARSRLLLGLFVALAIFALGEGTTEKDQLATQDQNINVLGQRLVRRNFLRFGKRSGSDLTSSGDDDDDYNYDVMKREGPTPTGPGERYEAILMGKQPHSASARSFLRFGRSGLLQPTQSGASSKRRADNFLRFGKRIPAEQKEEQLLARWKKFLLVMLAKVAEEEDALLQNRQVMDKKSSDFLRFG